MTPMKTGWFTLEPPGCRSCSLSTPDAPLLLRTSDAPGAQAIDAVRAVVFLAAPALTHADPTGGLSVIDVSHGSRPTLVQHLVVPGITRTVAATSNFVFARDSASIIDVVDLTA